MRQNLSKKEKELLSEKPEEDSRRVLFWKDFKPEFRPPEEDSRRVLFWKDFKPVFRPVDQIKSKSLSNHPHDSDAKNSVD